MSAPPQDGGQPTAVGDGARDAEEEFGARQPRFGCGAIPQPTVEWGPPQPPLSIPQPAVGDPSAPWPDERGRADDDDEGREIFDAHSAEAVDEADLPIFVYLPRGLDIPAEKCVRADILCQEIEAGATDFPWASRPVAIPPHRSKLKKGFLEPVEAFSCHFHFPASLRFESGFLTKNGGGV